MALSTAVLAVLAAIASLLSGQHANEAVMDQIEASDQWNYYQAKGIKAAVLDVKMSLTGAPNESDQVQAHSSRERAGRDKVGRRAQAGRGKIQFSPARSLRARRGDVPNLPLPWRLFPRSRKSAISGWWACSSARPVAFARNDQSPLARTSSELLMSTGEGKISLDRHRQNIEKKSNRRHRRGYLSTRPPQDNAHKLSNC